MFGNWLRMGNIRRGGGILAIGNRERKKEERKGGRDQIIRCSIVECSPRNKGTAIPPHRTGAAGFSQQQNRMSLFGIRDTERPVSDRVIRDRQEECRRNFMRKNKEGEQMFFKGGWVQKQEGRLSKLEEKVEEEQKIEKRVSKRMLESPWATGVRTEEQKKRYEAEVERIYRIAPKAPKGQRRCRKKLMEVLESNWETAVMHSESFGGEDLRVQAATKEAYRNAYLKWMLPLLIQKNMPVRSEEIPTDAWVILAKALLIQEGIERSRHLVYTRVWGFHRILYPAANSTPQRKIYLENFKSLIEVMDPLEAERGIELDCLLVLGKKLTEEMNGDEIKRAAGVRLDQKWRENILKEAGVNRRGRNKWYMRMRIAEKDPKFSWMKTEEEQKKARNEMKKRKTEGRDNQKNNKEKEEEKTIEKEIKNIIKKEILDEDEEESSILSPDSEEEDTEQEISVSEDEKSERTVVRGKNMPEQATAEDFPEMSEEPLKGERIFKCARNITMAEFFQAMSLAFWSFQRPGEWKDVILEDTEDPLGIEGNSFRRIVFTRSKGQRAGNIDVLEMRCCCGDFKRERPAGRVLMACQPCPVHCVKAETWEKVKRIGANRKSRMVLEMWEAMGWPTDGRPSQHILHLMRIGAAMTAGSGGIACQLVMAYGRWKSLEMAIYYEKMSGRVPALVAMRRWPVREAVLLDEEERTIDELVMRLDKARITFPLGRSMKEIATKRRINKVLEEVKKEEEIKRDKNVLDEFTAGVYGTKKEKEREREKEEKGKKSETWILGLNRITEREPDRIEWPAKAKWETRR